MNNTETFIMVTLIYTGLFCLLGVDNTIRLTYTVALLDIMFSIYKIRKKGKNKLKKG